MQYFHLIWKQICTYMYMYMNCVDLRWNKTVHGDALNRKNNMYYYVKLNRTDKNMLFLSKNLRIQNLRCRNQ